MGTVPVNLRHPVWRPSPPAASGMASDPTSSASPVLSPGTKTHSSLAAFQQLSPSLCSLPLSPFYAAPSCLRPRRAPLTPYQAVLSRRPSNRTSTLNNNADEATGLPTGRRQLGYATTSDPGPPIHCTSSRLRRSRRGRVSTLTTYAISTSPLPPSFANLSLQLVLSREGLRPVQVTLRPG